MSDLEGLTANGVDLASLCYMTPDISELLTVPNRRGDNAVVPGRHGAIKTTNKRFDVGELVLPMWIAGCTSYGTIPFASTERREFFKRRDELLRIFYSDDVTLRFTRPDGFATEAVCEVSDVIDFTRVGKEPLAKISIALNVLGAFWRDVDPVSQTITGATGTIVTLDQFAAATAPMADLQLTFTGPINNPRLTIGDHWLQYNGVVATGRELVLDSGTWSATAGFGLEWQPDVRQVFRQPGPAWFELDPTISPFQIRLDHTGGGVATCEIAGRRAYLSP
jgi:hypothetical protein